MNAETLENVIQTFMQKHGVTRKHAYTVLDRILKSEDLLRSEHPNAISVKSRFDSNSTYGIIAKVTLPDKILTFDCYENARGEIVTRPR